MFQSPQAEHRAEHRRVPANVADDAPREHNRTVEWEVALVLGMPVAAFAFGLWYDEDYSLKSIALNVVTAVFLWPITVLMLIFGFKEMMGKRQLRRRREELEAERIPQRETQ